MNSIVKVFSNFREFYSEINGATLTGAIDVVIVEQPDGTYLCSPFHVRFGKLGVLRSREKIVDIEVNGEPVDIHMKLGESGEAFFVEECLDEDGDVPAHMATSPIPTSSFETSFTHSVQNADNKQAEEEDVVPRPRRNSIDVSQENNEADKSKFENQKSEYSHRRHTDVVSGGRPDLRLTKLEYTTQKLRQEWAEAEQEQVFHLENGTNISWTNGTGTLLGGGAAENCDDGQNTHFKPIETVPATTTTDDGGKPSEELIKQQGEFIRCSESNAQRDEQLASSQQFSEDKLGGSDTKSKKKRRKKSIMKKKNTQRKNSSSSSAGSNNSDPNDGVETESMTASQITSTSSRSDSPKGGLLIAEGTQPDGDSKTLEPTATNVEAAKDSPLDKAARIHELDIHFFSDTEVAVGGSPHQSRPSTPIQSDSEFEISQHKSCVTSDTMSASWNWGELPTKPESAEDRSESEIKQAQRNSMLSGLMSLMKLRKNASEGLYLSDLNESLDPEIAALYFPQSNEKLQQQQQLQQHQQQLTKDEDRESGNGTSVPQSPTMETLAPSLDSDSDENKGIKIPADYVGLSLCGGLEGSNGSPSAEDFEKHRLKYADVCNNPRIFYSPDLVVRINGKYYSWAAACPQVMTMFAFHKALPSSYADSSLYNKDPALENVVETEIAKQERQEQQSNAAAAGRGGRWWYWRRSNDKATMKNENEAEQQPSSVKENNKSVVAATQTSRSNTPEDATPAQLDDTEQKTAKDDVSSLSSDELELSRQDSTAAATVPSASQQQQQLYSQNSFGSRATEKFRKTLRLSSEQIESLNLKNGMNEIVFSVTTAYQGTTRCTCYVFKWKYNDKVVISDIDGTITKSDVLGHILPMVGKNWEQIGVAPLFSKIEANGYKLLYLSARAIGQAKTTRDYLQSIRQGDVKLPEGPLLLNPTSLMSAFHREVIEKKPEQFKIACLSDIQALFPDKNPFYAGYGNRINDVWAYRAVGIPISRIFTINTKGELKHELTQTFQSTYANMAYIVDQLFPPIKHIEEEDSEFTSFNYWRDPVPDIDVMMFDCANSSSQTENGSSMTTTVAMTANSLVSTKDRVTPTSVLVQQALPTIPEN